MLIIAITIPRSRVAPFQVALGVFSARSTTEFRNAFLKTIRQIIRESVRNMSIPSTKQNLSQAPMSMAPRMSTGHVDKFDKQAGQAQNGNGAAMPTGALSKKAVKQQLLASSHKRKYSQSKQPPVEHESSEDKDQEEPPAQQQTFRSRSKTISDTSGKETKPLRSRAPS